MDRLSLVLILAVGPTLTGSFLTVVLGLGYYSWPVIAGAILLGLVLTWPVSYVVSRWIKRDDPDFDHTRRKGSLMPDPDAPEV